LPDLRVLRAAARSDDASEGEPGIIDGGPGDEEVAIMTKMNSK